MSVKLPKPLTEYFAAANTDDADRVAACFTEDAVVRDEGGDIHGHRAVRAWAQETRRKYRYHAEVVAVEGRRTDPAWVADAGGYELHIRCSLADVAHMVPKTVAPSAALH